MKVIKKAAVFCGSSTGSDPVYSKACLELARLLNKHKISLVYGGGNIGLMGILADEMLRLESEVIGVIPQKLVDIELAHTGLTQLHIVHTMHERKALMMELADIFIVLPGGIGTLDEFFEVFTWQLLEYHSKKISVLNINGFYDQLILFIQSIIKKGFLNQSQIKSLIISDSPPELIMSLLA
ncbi:MAG: TIGR00730 family Rossman fold protein [Bacteroidales bacterium]|nr:TIGR00730 family Rossman fold protein [Bacteroidales bacterium]